MPSNFEGLINILPNINQSPLLTILEAKGVTKKGILSIIFPNAEELFNTVWWSKFIEKYTMESPIKALLGGLNVGSVMDIIAIPKILPGIAQNLGRSKDE